MKVRGRTRSENVYVARQQSGGFRAGGGPQVKRVESMSKARMMGVMGWRPPLPEAVTEPAYTVMRKGMKDVYVRTKEEAERLERQGWKERPDIAAGRRQAEEYSRGPVRTEPPKPAGRIITRPQKGVIRFKSGDWQFGEEWLGRGR